MKKLTKMSLTNIEGKLTRKEMKNIMAGSGTGMTYNECMLWCPSQPNSWGYCDYSSVGSAGPGWYCRVG